MPSNQHDSRRRLLITAGPTHEPIDEVRYIANRSSGRVGIELALAASEAGYEVTLLMGPTPTEPPHTRITTLRFRTTEDLRLLLEERFPACDALVMAAAVADYRPRRDPNAPPTAKLPRAAEGLTLALESTPDLVAACAANRSQGQLIIGFALETADRVLESGKRKLIRKGVDAILANELSTLESPTIRNARLITPDGVIDLDPELEKADFARWLIESITARLDFGAWTPPPRS